MARGGLTTCPFSGLSPRVASGGARLPSLAGWVNYTKNPHPVGQGFSPIECSYTVIACTHTVPSPDGAKE